MYGGGSAEIACSLAVNKHADTDVAADQYTIRAFANALDDIIRAIHQLKKYRLPNHDRQK